MTHSIPRLFDIHELRVEDIDPDPNQPRQEMRNIEGLAASIRALGQLQPVIVQAIGNRYRLLGGERRWRAHKLLGLDTIFARLAVTDDEAEILISMADNFSEPLTEAERSRGVQRAFAFDVPVERISEATGFDALTVSRAAKGFARVADPVAAEDMSLDRLATIEEFADDAEVVEMLTNASEGEWRKKLREMVATPAPEPELVESHYSVSYSNHAGSFVVRKRGEADPVAVQIPTQGQAERICAVYREAGVV